MAVLGTAQDGAVDDTTRDGHAGARHVVDQVGHRTRVAAAAAVNVAVSGNLLDLCLSARHTDGATAHGNGRHAANVSHLVAAIHVVEDVAAGDIHFGFAPNLTRVRVPIALVFVVGVFLHVREPARATAKHIAEPRLAVLRSLALLQQHQIERRIRRFIRPVDGAVQAVCAVNGSLGRIDELTVGVQLILIVHRVVACADLSAADGHLGVASHVAAFCAAKHGGLHPTAADFHLGAVDRGHQVDGSIVALRCFDNRIDIIVVGILRFRIVHDAFTTAVHIT